MEKENIDITEIPEAVFRPKLQSIGDKVKQQNIIIIDVETSGTGNIHHCHIQCIYQIIEL